MDKPQIIVHVQKQVNHSLFDVRWIPCSTRFVVLGAECRGTGLLQIYDITKGDAVLLSEHVKEKALKCGSFGASSLKDRQLAVGDFAGTLQILDLEKPNTPTFSTKAHEEIINCIDGVGGGESSDIGAPEIVTGSRDGRVKVWDPRQEGSPVAVMEPQDMETKRDCWTVCFGNTYDAEERCIAAGYDNGDIKMFDLRNMQLRWETNVQNGVCCLEFDRKDIKMNKLVATTLESQFKVFDVRTQHPDSGFASLSKKAHKSTVWLTRHLPQNRDVFMTTGGSGSLCLWQYNYPASRTKELDDDSVVGVPGDVTLLQDATVASQPITGFEWNQDKQGLAVCTAFDQYLRVLIVTKLKNY